MILLAIHLRIVLVIHRERNHVNLSLGPIHGLIIFRRWHHRAMLKHVKKRNLKYDEKKIHDDVEQKAEQHEKVIPTSEGLILPKLFFARKRRLQNDAHFPSLKSHETYHKIQKANISSKTNSEDFHFFQRKFSLDFLQRFSFRFSFSSQPGVLWLRAKMFTII